MRPLLIRGAQAILPDRMEEASVRVEAGEIVEIGDPPRDGALEIEGRGLILAPAIVDVHGDTFERQVMPRPNVFFPTDVAVLDTDRQLAANGVATAYHALTLSWEPGLRSVRRGEMMIEALNAQEARLTVDNRLQLRWETFAFEALELIEQALAGPKTPSIAFNDHTSMSMRAFDVPVQDRAFELSTDFQTASLSDDRVRQRTVGQAERAGLSSDDYITLLAEVWERRGQVDDAISRVAGSGRRAGAPMLSHDDTKAETRDYYRDKGARIAEFPMNVETARAARKAGDMIVFGAPNVVRGGSHIGSPSAGDMVEDGLCDILASDYFYPALLAAAARLRRENRAPLERIWATLSANPARASHLDDRGEIAPGKRADLVLLDWPPDSVPAVRLTLSGGRVAYMSGDVL